MIPANFVEQFPVVFEALNVGFLQTLKLFIITLLGAIPLGLIISFGSMSKFKPLSALIKVIVWVVRGSPLMIQLLIIYFFPGLVFHNNVWGSGEEGRFIASAVAFILNYACYFSEIYRGGIEGVPIGQQEAGQVLGLTKSQIFFKITLLQMVKRIVPPMANEIITLVKDTSLASVIAIPEILMNAKDFSMQGLIWPLFYSAVFFLAFCGILTLLFSYIEKKLDYYKG
jgi:polar amino acid transport system permease protein